MENQPQPSAAAPDAARSAPQHALALPRLPGAEGWEMAHQLALRQLNRFMSCEAKVLKGENPEAIHDMRVASRRLQQVLDLLYPKPRPQEYRKLRRKIRGCRQVLGNVRNCDVLLEHTQRMLGRKRSPRREAWTAFEQYLLKQRAETYRHAVRKLGKSNLAVFYVNLKELLHQSRPASDSSDHHDQVSAEGLPEFSIQLTRALQPLWTGFVDQLARSHQDRRPAIVHGARIAAKRLRYLLEVFHEGRVMGAAEALGWLRQLQKHLGDWHDMEVLEQSMIEMLARPEFLHAQLPLAMDIERLILRGRQTKAGLEEKYFRMSGQSEEMNRLQSWVSYLLASPSEALADP